MSPPLLPSTSVLKPKPIMPLFIESAVEGPNRKTAIFDFKHDRSFPALVYDAPVELKLHNFNNVPFFHVALAEMNRRPVGVNA